MSTLIHTLYSLITHTHSLTFSFTLTLIPTLTLTLTHSHSLSLTLTHSLTLISQMYLHQDPKSKTNNQKMVFNILVMMHAIRSLFGSNAMKTNEDRAAKLRKLDNFR